jgi:hypothetical protein
MTSETRVRAGMISVLTLTLTATAVAGCGGDAGRPQDAFIGTWLQTAPDLTNNIVTGFSLKCEDADFTTVAPAAGRQFLIYEALVFEHGELTDLAEISGQCSPLNYDISGKSATPANPDPYLEDVPGCVIRFSHTIGTMAFPAYFILFPDASWTFTLLDEKTAGGADQGRLSGTASGHVIVMDGSATGLVSSPDCIYAGSDTFFRLTQP